jgi:hypothetical protein
MSQFVYDTFTETSNTALVSHTGETGATWATHSSWANASIYAANDWIYGNDSVYGCAYASGSPASADYSVTCVIEIPSGTNSDRNTGAAGRISTSAKTAYMFRLSGDVWQLWSIVEDSYSSLGTWTDTISAPATRTAKLEMSGTTITGYVDGVARVSVTNSDISAAGKAGIWVQGNSAETGTGAFTTSISADDLGGGIAKPVLFYSHFRSQGW